MCEKPIKNIFRHAAFFGNPPYSPIWEHFIIGPILPFLKLYDTLKLVGTEKRYRNLSRVTKFGPKTKPPYKNVSFKIKKLIFDIK
jgi:hypothetical protein